jgi:hypothetical protein
MGSRSTASAVQAPASPAVYVVTRDQLTELAQQVAQLVRAEIAPVAEPLGVRAASKAVGVGVRTLRGWISLRQIETIQPGGPGTKVLIPAAEIERIRAGRPAGKRGRS